MDYDWVAKECGLPGTQSMALILIALANIRFPETAEESVSLTEQAIADASKQGAALLVSPSALFLVCAAWAKGWLRLTECFWSVRLPPLGAQRARRMLPSCLALRGSWTARCGRRLSCFIQTAQRRVSRIRCSLIRPKTEYIREQLSGASFKPGNLRLELRSVTKVGVIQRQCAGRLAKGRRLVFHPHFSEAEPGSYRPTTFADPCNTFHEKAALCRAAENTCYFATVNYASAGSPTTSAVVRPDGTLLCYQPYGQEGLLIADLDLASATGLLANRFKPLVW